MLKCDFKFGSPDVVQVPGRPPRRWRFPPDLVMVEVGYHLKVVCHLIQQSLPHHHHCPHPGQEIGQRGKGNVSSSHICSAAWAGQRPLKHQRSLRCVSADPPEISLNKQGAGAQTWMPGQKLAVSLALL